MNFARSELMKYGWKEGDGLGKNSAGIIQPVRPKLKFDTRGVGFNYGEEYSFKWWEHVYDKAAANICVHSPEDSASLEEPKNEKQFHIRRTKIKGEKMAKSVRSKYNYFVKGAVLQNNTEIDCMKKHDRLTIFQSENLSNEKTCASNKSSVSKIKRKLNGKQLRLQLQEEQFLLNNVRINPDSIYSLFIIKSLNTFGFDIAAKGITR